MATARRTPARRTSGRGGTTRDLDREWAALALLDCSTCGEAVPHELLDCPDGHEDDCPDRVCTGCGVVVVVGPPLASTRTG